MSKKFDPNDDSSNSDEDDEGSKSCSLQEGISKSGCKVSIVQVGHRIDSNSSSSKPTIPSSTMQTQRHLQANEAQVIDVTSHNLSRFAAALQHRQSSPSVNVINTITRDYGVPQNGKPDLKSRLLNRPRSQLVNTDLQLARNNPDSTSLTPTCPDFSNLFSTNIPDTNVKQQITRTMPLNSINTSSVTSPPNNESRTRLRGSTPNVATQGGNQSTNRKSIGLTIDDNQKRYEEFVLGKFAELQLEYVHRKHCNEFFMDVQKDCLKHNIDPPAHDDTFTGDIKRMCNLLWKAVTEVEEGFDKNICFPSDEMRKRLTIFRDVQDSGLSIKIGTALRNKLKTFSDEYTSRNEEIQQQEKKSAETLIEESKIFYIEQTLLKLRGRYLDRQDLTRIEEECRADVESIFVKAFGFKSSHWQTYYTNKLKLILGGLDEIRKKNDENKKVLEKQLDDAAQNAVEIYNHNMSQSVIDSYEELANIDQTNHTRAMESYEVRVQDITRDQSKTLNESRLRLVTKALDDASRISRRTIEAQIKEEDERQSELDRLAREQRNRQEAAQAKYAEAQIKEGNQRQAELDRQAREQRNSQDAAQARYADATPRAGYSNRSGRQEVKLQDLNMSKCAIVSIGINHTSIMYYDANINKPGSQFAKSNYDWFKGPGVDFQSKMFLRSMLDEPVDKLHLVTRGKNTLWWTLIDFIIVLFKKFKRLLERIPGNINYCVVVLPQCLNIKQQECFRKGAEIVGFIRVDILSSTHAIALRFVRENWSLNKPNIIAVHVSGIMIDAALFFQTDKSLLCQAVAGDFFRDGTTKNYIKNIVWNAAKSENKQRINDIFNPMITKEKLTKDTQLLMFGKPKNRDEIAQTVRKIVPFDKVTMDRDSLLVGACIFARLVLQNDQTGLVQTVLNETKKQNARVHNLASGEIPSPDDSALQDVLQ